ncbi:unnamed protein product [Rotaria sp. Silwood2]|nr:unnamed protein product [Rotaria sp. Silwood2]CAF4082267.1 unnamed protein product [Rotaria sp. Silwood2]CAF4136840.1 unnamed protein product [Rotaria sp. Silwood2]
MLSIILYSSGTEVASAFTKTTGNNSLTLEQFQQVQLGWTRDQVTQFVGRPGKLITPQTSMSPHNWNTIIVQYQGSIPSNVLQRVPTVTFSFYNGILWKKNEKLLDLTSSYVITRDHYNQIQTGSPYQQVILTLGTSALISLLSKIVTVLYQNEGQEEVEGIGYIQLGFGDRNLESKLEDEWVSDRPNTYSSTCASTANAFLPNDRITFE